MFGRNPYNYEDGAFTKNPRKEVDQKRRQTRIDKVGDDVVTRQDLRKEVARRFTRTPQAETKATMSRMKDYKDADRRAAGSSKQKMKDVYYTGKKNK